MIKAICFDLDGVYFTEEGIKNFINSLVELGSTNEDAEYLMFKSDDIKKFKTGEIEESEFWDLVREYLKIDKTDEEFKLLLSSGYKVNQQVKDVVNKVRMKGYKTCICSNNFSSRIDALESKFHFLEDFDIQIFSYKVGATKPDIKIFQELIKQADVLPAEIIYSDDNEEKIKGAIELGINAFVYENFDQFLERLESLGVNLD